MRYQGTPSYEMELSRVEGNLMIPTYGTHNTDVSPDGVVSMLSFRLLRQPLS